MKRPSLQYVECVLSSSHFHARLALLCTRTVNTHLFQLIVMRSCCSSMVSSASKARLIIPLRTDVFGRWMALFPSLCTQTKPRQTFPPYTTHRLDLKVNAICAVQRNMSVDKGLVRNARVRLTALKKCKFQRRARFIVCLASLSHLILLDRVGL